MSNLHQCDICGFTDKQDDIYQTESGAWHHYECELDSLQPGKQEKQETDDDSDAVVDREEREGRERDLQLERDFNDNHGFHE